MEHDSTRLVPLAADRTRATRGDRVRASPGSRPSFSSTGRRYEPARYCVALAVAAITVGWALSRWPTILPGLSVHQAAAGHDTLVYLVVAVIAGGALLFPALALLFRLTLAGQFAGGRPRQHRPPPAAPAKTSSVRGLARIAVACLIAGIGLLNVADASWAHVLGVACLIGFVVSGFGAIAVPALDEPETA